MNSQEIEQSINDLGVELDRVRALYEQYFLGLEKLEPQIPLKNMERKMQFLRRERIHNTAQRFRFQQLVQRYNTMQTYWRRVSRQIEEGTYRPDVMKARARAERRRAQTRARIEAERQGLEAKVEEQAQEAEPEDLDDDTDPNISVPDFSEFASSAPPPPPPPPQQVYNIDPDDSAGTYELVDVPSPNMVKAARRQSSNSVRPAPPRPAPAQPKVGLGDERMRSIYNSYISSRERCNQSTQGLSFEKMRSQLQKQEKSLLNRTGKEVDFVVKVRDGRAVVRAVRKK